jgi:hypothetical protein
VNGFTLLTVTPSPTMITEEVLYPLQLNEDQTSDTVTGAVCVQGGRESVCVRRGGEFCLRREGGRVCPCGGGDCVCKLS